VVNPRVNETRRVIGGKDANQSLIFCILYPIDICILQERMSSNFRKDGSSRVVIWGELVK